MYKEIIYASDEAIEALSDIGFITDTKFIGEKLYFLTDNENIIFMLNKKTSNKNNSVNINFFVSDITSKSIITDIINRIAL